ncbi:miraculin-like [Diospyros lotus]|uniref:miraculin-like n=1 Tax=Diospyros lotus TaxID=55363 RepID=UPI0022528D36|nr:miraculin-like [Diospyros lotus]
MKSSLLLLLLSFLLLSSLPSLLMADNPEPLYDSSGDKVLPEFILCTAPRVWKVDDFDPSTEQWFITTTGDIRKPGPLTSLNWFKVEKFSALDGVYKINHCPGTKSVGLCKDVGIYYTEENRRLALSETPFGFFIIKAESVLNKAKIASVI